MGTNNADVGKQVEILIDDRIDRFKSGEVGTVIFNDSEKYDYFIELSKISKHGNTVARNFYFYKNEIKLL